VMMFVRSGRELLGFFAAELFFFSKSHFLSSVSIQK
jgi:hypothetical protein